MGNDRYRQVGRPKSFGAYKRQNANDYRRHAAEVRAVGQGTDVVEHPSDPEDEKTFDGKQLQMVRGWFKSRPLEAPPKAAAHIKYPRDWNTKRGRYSNVKLPGSGGYGLVRARPTF